MTKPPLGEESMLLQRRGKELSRVSTESADSASSRRGSQSSCGWDPSALERQITDGLTRAPDGTCIAAGPAAKEVVGAPSEQFQDVAKVGHGGGGQLKAAIDAISEDIFGLPFSVSVAIPTIEDTPLVGISDGFCKLTGWSREEIVGRNCRFLLKDVPEDDIRHDTRLEARRFCKAAYLRGLKTMSHAVLLQRNARKSGELFFNLFMMSLVPGPDKRNFVVGLQLDLGPTLDAHGGGEDMVPAAIHKHEDNLLMVRSIMFGRKLPQAVAPTASEQKLRQMLDQALVANDIEDWLSTAEGASAEFQQWGALPWVAWPQALSRYALLDGGVSLLRLEADRFEGGALAMSIFPAKKAAREVRFKVEVRETCPGWDLPNGSRLPTGGFTEIPPIAMDQLGGLPGRLEQTAKSVCLRGDGRLFRCDSPGHAADSGELAAGLPEPSESAGLPLCFALQAGDILEYVWGLGYLSLEVNGMEVLRSACGEGECAVGRPPKSPVYAIFDCCSSICRATLVL